MGAETMSSSRGVETMNVNHVKSLKQLEEMTQSLRLETVCREQGKAAKPLKSFSVHSEPVEAKAASLLAHLVDKDIISSEQDEEEEPFTPLFGLSDIWQAKASAAAQ